MNINVQKPEGNIFWVLGVFQRLTKELELYKVDTTEHRALLDKARSMKYDEILDEVERISNGSIKFTHRSKEE
jgi:hypothetical protein